MTRDKIDGRSRSKALNDLTGLQFHAWTVLKIGEVNNLSQRKWLCRCECGVEREVVGTSLRHGASKSCGCRAAALVAQRKFKAGSTKHSSSDWSPERKAWASMRRRCSANNHNRDRANYYERGISVCERWSGEGGFENFLADMGHVPSPGYTLDRIDNGKSYGPNNCRWADKVTQAQNRRRPAEWLRTG